MNNKKKLTLATLAVTTTLAIGWYLSQRPPDLAVALHEVSTGTVEQTVANTRTGTVMACQRSQLAPLVSGRVESIHTAKGQRVQAGQRLIELWNADLRAQLDTQRKELDTARSQANQACILADQAENERRRLQPLHAQGMVSDDQYKQAESTALAQQAACQAAREGITVAKSRLALAETNLKRTYLVAPFAGVVAELHAEPGEILSPGATIVDLIDDRCLYVSAPIDEIDAPSIRVGMPARVSIDAFPQRQFLAKVRRVAPYVLDLEKQARTVEVEVNLTEADALKQLTPGYSADVEIILNQRDKVLWAPANAVLAGKSVLVYHPNDGVLEARQIKTGLSNWQRVEIVDGLKAGERIVSSTERAGVQAGARVRPETP